MIKLDTEYESLDSRQDTTTTTDWHLPSARWCCFRLQSGLYKAVSDLFVNLRKKWNTQAIETTRVMSWNDILILIEGSFISFE